jgi:hypothetical protein
VGTTAIPLPSARGRPLPSVHFEPCRLPHQRSVTFSAFREDLFEENKKKFLATIPDARFRELDLATGGHHSADCYHLWTAELNELDVFLTSDKKFRHAVDGQRNTSSTVEIMFPEELCSLFSATGPE